jgi:hypothetical protein
MQGPRFVANSNTTLLFLFFTICADKLMAEAQDVPRRMQAQCQTGQSGQEMIYERFSGEAASGVSQWLQ